MPALLANLIPELVLELGVHILFVLEPLVLFSFDLESVLGRREQILLILKLEQALSALLELFAGFHLSVLALDHDGGLLALFLQDVGHVVRVQLGDELVLAAHGLDAPLDLHAVFELLAVVVLLIFKVAFFVDLKTDVVGTSSHF